MSGLFCPVCAKALSELPDGCFYCANKDCVRFPSQHAALRMTDGEMIARAIVSYGAIRAQMANLPVDKDLQHNGEILAAEFSRREKERGPWA